MPHAFGDLKSYRVSDAYACLVNGPYTYGAGCYGLVNSVSLGQAPGATGACYVARQANGVTALPALGAVGRTAPGSAFGTSATPSYPSPVDNGGVIGFPLLAIESNPAFNSPIRGEFRGLAEPLFNCVGRGLNVFDDVLGSDRRWLVVPTCFQSPGDRAFLLVDITGPWQA